MTKQEIEKAIENGESVWYVYADMPAQISLKKHIRCYDECYYFIIKNNTDLSLPYYYEKTYKTKVEAEHYLHHANVTRTETLPFVTWEEFLEERHLSFIGKNEIEYMLCIFGDKIDLAEHRACSSFIIKEWEATEENFYKAYDECVRLFMGGG